MTSTLEHLLSVHDFAHEYADAPGVWRLGHSEKLAISRELEAFSLDEALAILSKTPWAMLPEGQKLGYLPQDLSQSLGSVSQLLSQSTATRQRRLHQHLVQAATTSLHDECGSIKTRLGESDA